MSNYERVTGQWAGKSSCDRRPRRLLTSVTDCMVSPSARLSELRLDIPVATDVGLLCLDGRILPPFLLFHCASVFLIPA